MAFNIQKINPLDLQPRIAIGVDLPFSKKNIFRSTYTTKEALKANLINFFLTGKKERVFNINLGTNLRNLLFENPSQSDLQSTREIILFELGQYFPTLEVRNFVLRFENSLLEIFINYSIKNTNIEDEILINISN